MKKSDFYKIERQMISLIQTKHNYRLDQIKHVEIISDTNKKKISQQLSNTLTAALPFHHVNGDEKLILKIKITLEYCIEYIILNEEPVIRGNMDYYDMLAHARNLKKALINDCHLESMKKDD